MKINVAVEAALAAIATLAVAMPASAHIEYYDLNQGRQIADLTAAGKALVGNDLPIHTPANWTPTYQNTISSGETWTNLGGSYASGTWGRSVKVTNFDSSGWTDGLRTNPVGGANLLGDTHKVNFANFHLNQASYVSISVFDTYAGQGFGLNPSFSLYAGSAVYQAHDDATVDPLNPRSSKLPFPKIQSTVDDGTQVDSQGITSPYRNTLTNSGRYYGQFNAMGDFSNGNAAGDWSAVDYLTSVTGHVNPDGSWLGNANENSLLDYLLPAGDYIIAFSGHATPASYASARSGDHFNGTVTGETATLVFHAVAAVPEPGTWLLMLAGLALTGGFTASRSGRLG